VIESSRQRSGREFDKNHEDVIFGQRLAGATRARPWMDQAHVSRAIKKAPAAVPNMRYRSMNAPSTRLGSSSFAILRPKLSWYRTPYGGSVTMRSTQLSGSRFKTRVQSP